MNALLTAIESGGYDQVMVVVAIVVALVGASWFNSWRAKHRQRNEFYDSLRMALKLLDDRGPYDGRAQWQVYEALDRWQRWRNREVPPYAHADSADEIDAVELERELPRDRPRYVM